MPIEAVKIPQNVYVEDRIIGPITLKHLLIMGIGAGISYAIFASAQKAGVTNVVALGACWTPAAVAAAFAFFRINDLSLFNIILLSLEGMNKPTQRYWSPYPGISINLITSQHAKEIVEATQKAENKANKLADITRQLEKRQEEMNKLTAHENIVPTEGIRTQIESNVRHGIHEHDSVKDSGSTNDSPATAVRADRIQAEGLDPERSVDTIQKGRFDHLIQSPHA
jgi:hypothetical protein